MGRTAHWFEFSLRKRTGAGHVLPVACLALRLMLGTSLVLSRVEASPAHPSTRTYLDLDRPADSTAENTNDSQPDSSGDPRKEKRTDRRESSPDVGKPYLALDDSARGDADPGHESRPPTKNETKDEGKAEKSRPPTRAELEHDLRAPRPEKRRSAIKQLAQSKERAAWDLVLESLDDPEPMVADEAQLALAEIQDKRLLADLYGSAGLSARKAAVRARVAEAFGRMSLEVDGAALMRAVSCAAPEVSRMIVWSIERLAVAQKLGGDRAKTMHALEGLCRAQCGGELRCAALQALLAIDGAVAKSPLLEALVHKDPSLRCAGLLGAQSWTEVECTTWSQRLLADPQPVVRAQAIENLEKVASKSAVLALIAHMDLERRERLRYGILAYLQTRSGLAHGFDAAAWRSWAEEIVGAVTTGEAQGVRLGPVGDTRVAFAGLNVISDRVCFLIDCSGSLWQTKVGQRTRKEIADAMLRKALEALPAGTEFNLIPYTNEPFPWEKELVPSRPENVKRAIQFFERCHQTGKGNFFDAVQLALSAAKVDTIVVLTDGAPTGGQRWNLDLMFNLLVEQNRFRKVAFDSILVDAPKPAQRKWSDLAQRSGGRSIAADLK